MPELTKNLEHSDSFCTPDQHIRLLTALENRNFEKFEEILKTGLSNDSIDVNHWYDDPHYSTLLDICCKSCGNSQFVKLLLRYGANPNLINKTRKKGPIHFATEYSDFETVKYLIQNSQTDVNLSDNTGSSALHIAAKTNKIENLKILLQHPKININSINKKGQTPLHIAANQANKEVVCILLNHPEIDLDRIKMYSDETCRDVIKEKLPELVPQLISESERGSNPKITDTNTKMFSYLYRKDSENFIKNLKTCENIDDHDGGHTYLQYACDFGLTDVVKCLLDSGVNPNKCCPTNNATPLMIAAKRGYVNIIKLLTQQSSVSYKPINEESVLHSLIYGISLTENNDPFTAGEERNIYKCLEYILEAVSADKLDINRGDLKGNTALHYAGKLGEKKIILMLLKHGAYIGKKNIFGEPAVANIPRKVLEEYLDECIDTNEKLPREDNYEVIFNYNFLVPPKQFTTVSSLSENTKTSQVAIEMDEDVPQIEVPHTHCETAPLLYMSKYPELRSLLKHPVFTSFINLKWYSIRKYFYMNLIFYLTFWFLLTYYILTIYGTVTNSQPGTTMISNTTAATTNNNGTSKFDFSLWIVMLILCLILTVRELFQFTVSPLAYLATVENWLEIGLIITTCIILLCTQSCNDIRNQVSAVAILLSWTELVLLIGRHPLLSTNIEMFKTVTYNFLKFLAWYSIFILAFALSFYMLFKDDVFENNEQNFFQDPAKSLFKSVVMLTGEFDASSIPFQAHPGISHILFVLFVFLIAIVLFNLLNGLAVSDTQAIKADAELVSYVSRIKLIAYFESMIAKERLPKTDNIRSTLKCCCITPAVRRRTRTRGEFRIRKSAKNSFYKEINLFPNLLPDNLIRVLPNQECRVVLPNCNQNNNKTRNSDNSCMENCQAWYIDPPIIKCAKTIIARRTEIAEDDNTNIRVSLNKYQDQLSEYKQKLENVQNDSEKTKEMLQEILAILHRTSCDSKL